MVVAAFVREFGSEGRGGHARGGMTCQRRGRFTSSEKVVRAPARGDSVVRVAAAVWTGALHVAVALSTLRVAEPP